MITGIVLAAQTFLGRFWWQVPLVLAICVGVLRWDHNRIARKVEFGKTEVRVEIGKANEKAVDTADRVRTKSAAPRVRAVANPDPYAGPAN